MRDCFNCMRSDRRIHVNCSRRIKTKEIILRLVNGRTAAVADTERGAQVDFVWRMFVRGNRNLYLILSIIDANILIIAWVTCHKGDVGSQQYVQDVFHATNLYPKTVQQDCKNTFFLKIR